MCGPVSFMLRWHCHVQVHKLCLKQLSCNIHIDLNKKQHPLELCNIKPLILRVIQEEFFQMYFSLYSIQVVLKSVYCRSDHFWFLIHATNVKSSLPQIFFLWRRATCILPWNYFLSVLVSLTRGWKKDSGVWKFK